MTLRPRPRAFLFPALLLLFYVFMPLALLRFLFAMYLLFIVLSFLYSALVPRRITVERADDSVRANRFQRFTVRLVVRNRGIVPVHLLTVKDLKGGLFSEESGSFLLGLGPYESRTLAWEAESHERGDFAAGPVELKGSDPLGLFPWRATVDAKLRVIVYPAVYPVRRAETTGLPAGNLKVTSRIYEDVTNFRSVREYTPGDELRRINWKASARLGRLYTMEYMPSIYFPVLIAVNLTDADYPISHKQQLIERAVEVAASLVFSFVGLRQEVGLVTTGRLPGQPGFPAVPIRAGYAHAVGMLEILARIATSLEQVDVAEYVFRSGIPVRTGTKVFVITPPLREAQVGALLGIRRKGYDTEVIFVSSSSMRREDLTLHGIRSHAVEEMGSELFHG